MTGGCMDIDTLKSCVVKDGIVSKTEIYPSQI
jgi:hypothetical protein